MILDIIETYISHYFTLQGAWYWVYWGYFIIYTAISISRHRKAFSRLLFTFISRLFHNTQLVMMPLQSQIERVRASQAARCGTGYWMIFWYYIDCRVTPPNILSSDDILLIGRYQTDVILIICLCLALLAFFTEASRQLSIWPSVLLLDTLRCYLSYSHVPASRITAGHTQSNTASHECKLILRFLLLSGFDFGQGVSEGYRQRTAALQNVQLHQWRLLELRLEPFFS